VAPYNLNLSVKNFKFWNKTAMKTQSNFGIIFINPVTDKPEEAENNATETESGS
jgi:hypothetical protein